MWRLVMTLTAAIVLLGVERSASAQEAPAERPTEGMIRLNFPENTEVKVLIEYVSQRLGMNIMYDEKVGKKRITMMSPAEVPRGSLLGLLRSVLKTSNLVLRDADQPGWKEIVPGPDLAAVTRDIVAAGVPLPPDKPLEAVTQVIQLQYVTPKAAEQVLKPFLTLPGGNTFAIPDRSLLILTDYACNFRRLLELIRLTDQPGPPVSTRFYRAKHAEPTRLAQDVARVIEEREKLAATADRPTPALPRMVSLDRTGQLAVIAPEQRLAEVMGLVEAMDVPLDTVTRIYQFEAASPGRVEKLVREIIDPTVIKHRYRSFVDKEAGILVVTAPASVHERIESLKRGLDVIAERQVSPIRVYKLVNTTAAEVLATIQSLRAGKEGLARVALPGGPESGGGLSAPVPGPNPPPGEPGGPPPVRPAEGGPESAERGASEGRLRPIAETVQTEEATVTSDPNTNSIIVVAPPAIQKVYEELIKVLDKRRPQVLVEVTLVTLDTSDGFSLGVEILHEGSDERHRYVNFSSFGLSTVDVDAGSLALKPGVGFNGTLVSPDTVDLVIKALQSTSRARVVSAPRILVNDNATGTLESIAEEPFTTISSLTPSVTSTSFAGYAEAGTTIEVTPHISEGDHLQLKYSVKVNSFTGSGSQGIPPPRKTDAVDSEVTMPNGHAVIVGGLSRKDVSEVVDKVPLLGDIPILKYLFGSRVTGDSEVTLFVFIRPVILRDDNFEGLKYLSERDLAAAGLPGNYPASEPLLID